MCEIKGVGTNRVFCGSGVGGWAFVAFGGVDKLRDARGRGGLMLHTEVEQELDEGRAQHTIVSCKREWRELPGDPLRKCCGFSQNLPNV